MEVNSTLMAQQFDRRPVSHEQRLLDEAEKHTEEQQKKDLMIKKRVRVAKLGLRGINLCCSVIILSMLSATFATFNATKSLQSRNNFPPWAPNTRTWPQITVLVIACISMVISTAIIYGYLNGGHRKAEKIATFTAVLAVPFFIFSTVLWVVGAILVKKSKNGDEKDIWGQSCKNGRRSAAYNSDVAYDLLCHFQNWSFSCCIIEISVEVLTVIVYIIIVYRYRSKWRLQKAMATRDRAQSRVHRMTYSQLEDERNASIEVHEEIARMKQDRGNGPALMDIMVPAQTCTISTETRHSHAQATPDERLYAAVAIPTAYNQ